MIKYFVIFLLCISIASALSSSSSYKVEGMFVDGVAEPSSTSYGVKSALGGFFLGDSSSASYKVESGLLNAAGPADGISYEPGSAGPGGGGGEPPDAGCGGGLYKNEAGECVPIPIEEIITAEEETKEFNPFIVGVAVIGTALALTLHDVVTSQKKRAKERIEEDYKNHKTI